MKNLFNEKSLIMVFLLLNICAISIILILNTRTVKLNSFTFDSDKKQYAFSALPNEVTRTISVGSRAYIIYDSVTRSVVFGKNEKLRFAPASSAKIMSALVALEYYDLDQVLIAQNVDSIEGSKMKLIEGEQIIVRNLLYGMMLPSGNDAAMVLAQRYPGGVEGFVEAMNRKARGLQMTNTKFVDPDGFDDANYTTAFDLARLGAYAMNNSAFKTIVGTKQITVYDITGNVSHDLRNLNELLGIDNINGIKTGFTNEAGGVLVTSIEKNSRRYIIVVLNSADRFADTKNVVESLLEKIQLFFY